MRRELCDVKVTDEDGFLAIMKERIWINCVASGIACHCLEFYQRDVTDGMPSPWKPPVDVVSKSFQKVVVRRKLKTQCSLSLGCVSTPAPHCTTSL